MANLLIKPTTGPGNKVIIQDQAGGDIITSSDSGATLADGVQDNITRLGTVTTGNITTPLASATFPAGHQLQMVQSSNDLSQVANITSGGPYQSNSLPYVDIVPKAANSKYHMYAKLYIGCDAGPSQPAFAFSVSTDGGSSYTHKIGSSAWSYGSFFSWNQLNGEWTVYYEDWYGSSFSADQANIRFAMCYWNVYHATSQYAFNAGTGEDHGGHVIIKEIAT